MAKRSKIAQEAYDIAKPYAEEMGLDLVDAEYKKEGQSMFLRLFVDKKGGLSIDDCENFSRIIDPVFDEKLEHDADYFEVSSPGLTRPLSDASDYKRYEGELLDVNLFKEMDGAKSLTGKIVKGGDGNVTLQKDDGTEVTIDYKDISKAVRHIVFN
ncbi:MAG: ribosome maturation factor RimP [Clostridiales bacterium]|nr:ribosome maturation factor RimP [Clostridiales bacterium]